jgi:acetyl-CoA carboxylase biotin carboxylase subunit
VTESRSVLIANRGEIAVRINKACKELGIRTIQVYSDADIDSLAVKMADEIVHVGASASAKSYLNSEKIIVAAQASGADAIHPGYGFLAENAAFASAVEESGVKFIGPSSGAIKLLGDKISARELVSSLNVPTVPGSEGRLSDLNHALVLANKIGYPLMIKATAGGGGRGIRLVQNEDELAQYFPQASAEALASFGDGGLYLEKYIANARHIEVQILGDGERYIHLFERDCSLQRRRQKVWEEAPAVCLSDEIRKRMCGSALGIAAAVKYSGAGTVEFLYDVKSEEYYFLEVNTRIQVEHPITEMVTGIDIVKEMIQIGFGQKLTIHQDKLKMTGHAIECRINAEDPAKDFMPWPGTVSKISVPSDTGIRFDSMLFDGYEVPPFYDSLLGKLIVYDSDRASAIKKLKHSLDNFIIEGIPTTLQLHKKLVRDESVVAGKLDIEFLEKWLFKQF